MGNNSEPVKEVENLRLGEFEKDRVRAALKGIDWDHCLQTCSILRPFVESEVCFMSVFRGRDLDSRENVLILFLVAALNM